MCGVRLKTCTGKICGAKWGKENWNPAVHKSDLQKLGILFYCQAHTCRGVQTQTLIERVARTGTAKVLAAHRDVQSKKHRQTVHKKASTLGYFRFVCYEGNNENMNLIAQAVRTVALAPLPEQVSLLIVLPAKNCRPVGLQLICDCTWFCPGYTSNLKISDASKRCLRNMHLPFALTSW